MKLHLSRIVGNVKLTFEELTTVLTQIESCLNSRPLALQTCDDDGIEPLTPGHFLIGRTLEALPDPDSSYHPISLLRRWDLCQTLVRHFWQRWATEYLTTLQKLHKWHHPSKNVKIGDVVLLREDSPCTMAYGQGHQSSPWTRWACQSRHGQDKQGYVYSSCG